MEKIIPSDESQKIHHHTVARQWRSLLYQIHGRFSALLAQKHGKRSLREGTPERLRQEIIERCEKFFEEQKGLSQADRATIYSILINHPFLFRKTSTNDTLPSKPTVQNLIDLTGSTDNPRQVYDFLKIIGISSASVDAILLDHTFNTYFTHHATSYKS